jgi:hypothetical protein
MQGFSVSLFRGNFIPSKAFDLESFRSVVLLATLLTQRKCLPLLISALGSTADANLNYEVSVAAGNDGTDFGGSSPADEPSAFAVGASDSTDAIASFSNYGATLGAFAPGVDVISTWNNGETVGFPPL